MHGSNSDFCTSLYASLRDIVLAVYFVQEIIKVKAMIVVNIASLFLLLFFFARRYSTKEKRELILLAQIN